MRVVIIMYLGGHRAQRSYGGRPVGAAVEAACSDCYCDGVGSCWWLVLTSYGGCYWSCYSDGGGGF